MKDVKSASLNTKWKVYQRQEYRGKKVSLNNPFRTPDGPKKSLQCM